MSTLSLLDKCRPIYSCRADNLSHRDELAAVTAEIRRATEDDKFPHAPRLDLLRAALGKFDAAAREPTPLWKAPPPAKAQAGAAITLFR